MFYCDKIQARHFANFYAIYHPQMRQWRTRNCSNPAKNTVESRSFHRLTSSINQSKLTRVYKSQEFRFITYINGFCSKINYARVFEAIYFKPIGGESFLYIINNGIEFHEITLYKEPCILGTRDIITKCPWHEHTRDLTL